MPSTFPKRFHEYAPFAEKVKDLSRVGGTPPDIKAIAAALHKASSLDEAESLANACMNIEERLERISKMPEFKGEKGAIRNAKLNPELEAVMTLAIKKLPKFVHNQREKHISARQITIEAGKVKIKIASDEYFNAVANMIKRVSDLLLNSLNIDPNLTADMAALNAALKGFEDYKAAGNAVLDEARIKAKLDEYKGGLTTLTKERMVAHLDKLSAKKCNNFFANLDKHAAILLDSKNETSTKVKEILGSDACNQLIEKLAVAPNMSADNVNSAINDVYQILLKQLYNPANYITQVVMNACAAEMIDAHQPNIRQDFPGQKALNEAINKVNSTVAHAIEKSGMQPTDYPKNDIARLYALAQNVAEVLHAYTSQLTSDKSESIGHQHKMAEFEKIQRDIARAIAKYDGTNCAGILAEAQKIVHTSIVNKFDKRRPLIGDGGGINDGLKANDTVGDDRATKAMKALDAKLTAVSANYQSDGQKYVQAQQMLAAKAAAKTTVSGAAMKTAERTPATEAEKAKAQSNAAAASNASATGRTKTPPAGTQRNRDTSPPKLQG